MQQNRASRTLAIISFALLLAALTQAARAEIVYTPVTVVIQNNTYGLDLNNDGTADFTIKGVNKYGECYDIINGHNYGPNYQANIRIQPVAGNGAEGGWKAAALNAGSIIGPGQSFYGAGSQIEFVKIGPFWHSTHPPPTGYCENFYIESGNWLDVTGYVGLEFLINGQTHYGWAAVRVQFDNSQVPWSLFATLTGYAYETTPGHSIAAGQTSGP
jgi:hypothetical protein